MKINWFKIYTPNYLSDFIRELIYLLVTPSNENLIKFLNLLTIGRRCKDCEKSFRSCECNIYFELEKSEIQRFLVKFIYNNINIKYYFEIAMYIQQQVFRFDSYDNQFLSKIMSQLRKDYENKLV